MTATEKWWVLWSHGHLPSRVCSRQVVSTHETCPSIHNVLPKCSAQKPYFQLNVTNIIIMIAITMSPDHTVVTARFLVSSRFLVCWCKWWHWVLLGGARTAAVTAQVLPTLPEHHWPQVLPTLPEHHWPQVLPTLPEHHWPQVLRPQVLPEHHWPYLHLPEHQISCLHSYLTLTFV
jgi:hypothetical protein